MASAWIRTRETPRGQRRFRVEYRLGGRESRIRYGGSFKTMRLAKQRRDYIAGELTARRVPDLTPVVELPRRLTLREAAASWRASRIDVDEGTRTNDRVNTERVFAHDPRLADTPLDELSTERWALTFAELAERYKRGTLKKSREAFAMLYDHHAIEPNPIRDKRVKLPHERKADLIVPLAIHVEAVARVLPRHHLLPYLVIDWTAVRVGALEEAKVRDLDEHRQAFLARLSVAKNERPVWLALHDVLFEAVLAALPPREDRDLDAPLFPGFKGSSLRTAITRACKATGTPHFYPHGLRKRRGSLLAKQGYTLAEIAERLGDTKVVTAEHYLYALGDYAEVDYREALARG
jgi:integrase